MSLRVQLRMQLGALSLDVDIASDGQPLALVGPNGSGKTTLLRAIAGVGTPLDGEIEVDGTPLFSTQRGIDLPIEARRVGYMPQGYGLFPHLSALDNVAFGVAPGAGGRASRRRVARDMLRALECESLAPRLPHALSGGEQQRVALARALVIEPRALLLDEPLGALDVSARRAVRRYLTERLRVAGRPTVFVTHDVRDVAALSAHVCVLEAGRVIQRGSLAELRAAPASEFVAELLGLSDTPDGAL